MKPQRKRGLKKVALVLALAGYCVVPAALAEPVWVDSGSTGVFNGTVPWFYTKGGDQVANKDHISVKSDFAGDRKTSSSNDHRMFVGDTLTVQWDIGDREGDVDVGTLSQDGATTATIKWYRSDDDQRTNRTEITGAAGKANYTLTDADRGKYIGVDITPTTQTGVPNVGLLLALNDISTASGGGDDSDDVDPGPVVNQNLKVAIFEKGTQINLLKNTSAPIALDKTYSARLYSDEDNSGDWSNGDIDVTSQYDYAWVFTGTSGIARTTSTGIANSSFDNKDIVIPATNAEAAANLNGGGRNDKPGLDIQATDSDGVQGMGLSIIYKHH